MKTGIMAALRRGVVLASVFAPFLVVLIVLLTHPSGSGIFPKKNTADLLSWISLVLLAAMMLGIYFLTAYVVFHAFERKRTSRSKFAARETRTGLGHSSIVVLRR